MADDKRTLLNVVNVDFARPTKEQERAIIADLVKLKRFDVMAYARARIPAATTLNAGVGIVDEAVAQADAQAETGDDVNLEAVTELVMIAKTAKLRHGPEGGEYATIEIDGHLEHSLP